MTLSIIITTYNNRGLLRQLLRGIFRYPPKISFEILVIDNASQDGVVEMMENEFPSVQFIRMPENKGLAAANNVGFSKAQGEYVLVLNPDIAIFEGSIDALIAFMQQHPNAGLVGPKLLHPDKSLQFSTFTFPRWYVPILRRTPLGRLPWAKKQLRRYLMKDWDHLADKKVDWVLGAVMCIKASALRDVGMQDEQFFLYFEDVDLCRRFWRKGYEVWYAHKVTFVHYHKRESAENPGLEGIMQPTTKIHITSWFKYLKKYQWS